MKRQEKKNPKKEVNNEGGECIQTYVKGLLGHLCYLRKLFPSPCFKATRYGSAIIMMLNESPDLDQDAKLLYDLLKHGIEESIALKCLKTMQFVIKSRDKDESVLEKYSFDFSYTQAYSAVQFERLMAELSHKLSLMVDTLDPLPTQTYFVTKLLFYSERVPSKYWRPAYFEFEGKQKEGLEFKEKAIEFKFSCFQDRHERCQMHVKSTKDALLSQEVHRMEDTNEIVVSDTKTRSSSSSNKNNAELVVSKPKSTSTMLEKVKQFIISDRRPILKLAMKNIDGLEIAEARQIFKQLEHQSIIVRRGKRYFMAHSKKDLATNNNAEAAYFAKHAAKKETTMTTLTKKTSVQKKGHRVLYAEGILNTTKKTIMTTTIKQKKQHCFVYAEPIFQYDCESQKRIVRLDDSNLSTSTTDDTFSSSSTSD